MILMERHEALELVKKNVFNQNLVKHMLAVEAIMRSIAKATGHNEEKYALAGLCHDIDFEQTKDDHSRHGLISAEMLKGKVDEEILECIKRHNELTGNKPVTEFDKALVAADAVSGLVTAAALIMPSKKLADVKIETLQNKFKKKDFARNVNREDIMLCEQIGFSLDKFLELSLHALQKIAPELSL
jgi:putative nucleotidyltransferase with HDIG domain